MSQNRYAIIRIDLMFSFFCSFFFLFSFFRTLQQMTKNWHEIILRFVLIPFLYPLLNFYSIQIVTYLLSFFFSSSKYFLLKNRKNSMYTRCVFLFFKRPNPESINFTLTYLRTNVKFSQSRSISYLLMIKYNNTSPNTPIRQKFLNFKNVLLPYFYCLPLY